jgi:hypothetical protein
MPADGNKTKLTPLVPDRKNKVVVKETMTQLLSTLMTMRNRDRSIFPLMMKRERQEVIDVQQCPSFGRKPPPALTENANQPAAVVHIEGKHGLHLMPTNRMFHTIHSPDAL